MTVGFAQPTVVLVKNEAQIISKVLKMRMQGDNSS